MLTRHSAVGLTVSELACFSTLPRGEIIAILEELQEVRLVASMPYARDTLWRLVKLASPIKLAPLRLRDPL